MLPTVATGTEYGHMGLMAMAAMATLAVLMGTRSDWLPAAAMLLVFALARGCISHAGEMGVPSTEYCLEVVHLLLVGVWLGGVAVAAWIVLPAARRSGIAIAPYLQALSTAATFALAGVVASGVFNACQRLDSLSQLTASTWALALVAKLVLFAAAVLLGAYNRWWGFPGAGGDGGARAMLMLRIESIVLVAALAAAACLTVQPPPG
jgi:putative copper export protein